MPPNLTPDTPHLALHYEVPPHVQANDERLAHELLRRLFAPLPTQTPWQWVCEHVRFNEPEIKGPFDPTGRRYMEQPINDNANDEIHDWTLCAGTGIGKTIILIAGKLWKIKYNPFRGLWVMPTTHGPGGVANFNKTRFTKAVEATHPDLMPRGGQARFDISSLKIRIGGTVIDFAGSNSPGQLGANRCSDVTHDEVDKSGGSSPKEANAVYLADERTKGVLGAKKYKTSTPTLDTGAIWESLLKSNLNRRFLPCPHCNDELRGEKLEVRTAQTAAHPSHLTPLTLHGWFVLAWSPQYTLLPTKFASGEPIPMAFIRWDPSAKRKDNTWDLELVAKTTHLECPHCHGKITDHHRTWMDAHGQWLPTLAGNPNHIGYHLSSLYAPYNPRDTGSSLGGMALKFLQSKESAEGMKGFINSDLAEPDAKQEHGGNKIELADRPVSQTDWVPLLTADFHKNYPYIWFVVRKWSAFKLLPPFPITNGLPDFVDLLDQPGNEAPRDKCESLLGLQSKIKNQKSKIDAENPAWPVIAELMRFDSRTGPSPLIDFLIAQKITGQKLVKLYREECQSNTMTLRKAIYRLMSAHSSTQNSQTPKLVDPPRGGDSELIATGHLDLSGEALWEELRDLIAEYRVGHGMPIPAHCVAIDCGFADKFNRQVLQKCFESGTSYKFYDPMSKNRPAIFYQKPIHQYCQPCPADGWLAIRGKPTNRPLGDGKINRELSIHVEDPYYGTVDAGSKVCEVLEVPQSLFWIRKNDLRLKRTKNQYTISPEVDLYPRIYQADGTLRLEGGRTTSNFKLADYEKHLNEQYYDETKGKVEPKHGRGGSQARAFPYHLDDCETYQVALATHHEFFEASATPSQS